MFNYRNALVMTACFALSACAAANWVKPGATEADLKRESYECEKDARQSGHFGGGIVGALNFRGFQERCMVAHGWDKVERP